MEFFFKPRGIALIGATANQNKDGYSILHNLKTGFKGAIHPVNPAYDEIDGLKCYASVAEVPDPVDLAIVFIPARLVPQVIEDCAARGIKGVMIESGGFAETGPDGQALQAELSDLVRRTGIRLWGPNCMGLVDAVHRYVFSFVSPTIWEDGLPEGDVSLIVQSGMLSGGFLIDTVSHGTMGISKVCSIGNKVDVNECDLLEYMIDDPATKAIGLYLEAIPHGRRFMELCRRSAKPIVVLKGARSTGGAAAAMSHTASLAGNSGVIDGALAQAGVVQATGFKQMMDLCRSLAAWPTPTAKAPGRVAVLTYSGGAGIVTTDYFDNLDLELAQLGPETKAGLAKVFPEWMPVSNPVDLWPAVERNGAGVYQTAVEAVAADPNVDAVMVHLFVGGFALNVDIDALAQAANSKPLFGWLLGRRDEARELHFHAHQIGVPLFREIYRSAECLSAVFSPRPEGGEETPPVPEADAAVTALLPDFSAPSRTVLDEFESKRLLAIAGLPVVDEAEVTDADQARAEAARLGWPVVMKGLVPGQVHKTESGLVRLDLDSPEAVGSAFAELSAKTGRNGRIIVQRQEPSGLELIVGLVRDAQFGPAVMVGLGGVLAEALARVRFVVAPVSHAEALAAISSLDADHLLDGWRGQAPVDRDQLADIITNLARLGLNHPEISQVDVNPLIVVDGHPVAVDASVIVEGE